jgi:hypothetical protein
LTAFDDPTTIGMTPAPYTGEYSSNGAVLRAQSPPPTAVEGSQYELYPYICILV